MVFQHTKIDADDRTIIELYLYDRHIDIIF